MPPVVTDDVYDSLAQAFVDRGLIFDPVDGSGIFNDGLIFSEETPSVVLPYILMDSLGGGRGVRSNVGEYPSEGITLTAYHKSFKNLRLAMWLVRQRILAPPVLTMSTGAILDLRFAPPKFVKEGFVYRGTVDLLFAESIPRFDLP